MTDPTFVIEVCQNCHLHQWNTRHNEEKYNNYFKMMAAAIISRLPNAIIMRNQIPKEYVSFDCYSNLVPNDDESNPYYQMVPRIGAFEVSHQGVVVFSKYKGNYWPDCQIVADKAKGATEAMAKGGDVSQFLAGGNGAFGSQKSLNTKASVKSLKPNRNSQESLHAKPK
jgi:hypothetical protein